MPGKIHFLIIRHVIAVVDLFWSRKWKKIKEVLLQNRDYNILVAMYTYPQLAHRPTRQTFGRQSRSNWSLF